MMVAMRCASPARRYREQFCTELYRGMVGVALHQALANAKEIPAEQRRGLHQILMAGVHIKIEHEDEGPTIKMARTFPSQDQLGLEPTIAASVTRLFMKTTLEFASNALPKHTTLRMG